MPPSLRIPINLKENSLFLMVVVLIKLTAVSIDLALPLFSKIIFDVVNLTKDVHALNIFVGSAIAFFGISFFLTSCAQFLELYALQRLNYSLRDLIFTRVLRMQSTQFREYPKSDLIIHMTDDVERVCDKFFSQKFELIIDITQMIGIVALCFTINSRATYLIMGILPIYFLFSRFIFKRELGVVRDLLISQKTKIISYLNHSISQISVIKSFRQEKSEGNFFQELCREDFSLKLRDKILKTIYSLNSVVGFDLSQICITWILGYWIIQGNLTLGDAVSLLLLLSQAKAPILRLSGQFGRFRASQASIRRLSELLNCPSEPILSPSLTSVEEGKIEIKNLHYQYPGHAPIFKSLNLVLPPRSYIAIVGGNGSGKSTLTQLMLRFLEPQKGQILLDGQDISQMNLSELRQGVMIINHQHGIFPGTLRKNLGYGSRVLTDSQLRDGLRNSVVEGLIDEFPEGLDTQFTSSEDLPFSQRQRISIARAILAQPRVLILDEVTDGLDTIHDSIAQEAFKTMKETQTIIIISHRGSVLRNVDHILFFEAGQIVEQGKFETLMNHKGRFFRYFSSQNGGLSEFKTGLDHEMERCRRHQSFFSIVSIHANEFLKLVGNESLETLSRLRTEMTLGWAQIIRRGDSMTALENGHFLILLPQVKAPQAQAFLKRTLPMINQKAFFIQDKEFQFHFYGFAKTYSNVHELPQSPEDLLSKWIHSKKSNLLKRRAA